MRTRRYRGGRRCSGGNGGERWKDRGTLLSQQKITALIAVGGTLLMMISPQSSLASARKAVVLWLFTVLPSMLPFFICTDLLMRSGMHIRLGNLFERPFRKLFGVPGVAGFAYISSILSGYPTGAKILGELCEKGQIRRQDVRDILTFCSTSGPLFILGAVGSGMLQSAGAGYIMLAAHYAGSLLTGLFLIRRSALRRAMSAATGRRDPFGCLRRGIFSFLRQHCRCDGEKKNGKKIGAGASVGVHRLFFSVSDRHRRIYRSVYDSYRCRQKSVCADFRTEWICGRSFDRLPRNDGRMQRSFRICSTFRMENSGLYLSHFLWRSFHRSSVDERAAKFRCEPCIFPAV